MLRSTSRFEQLKLEDKTVTECEIFQKATVVIERKEKVTEEVMNSKDPNEQSLDGMVTDSKTIAKITSCEDLIAEIFARLPLKCVIRLRCLSKSWYSRIASPDFIRVYTLVRTMNTPEKFLIQHETCNENKGNLIEIIFTLHSRDRLPLCPRRGYMDVTPVQIPFWFWYLNIIGSCNGIVCFYQETIGFVLWNFSVRRQVEIPNPPFMRAGKEAYVGSVGFGFDSVTHDYKMGILENKKANSLFIYSLKTNSWSEIELPNTSSTTRFYGNQRACFLDGSLHWVETRILDGTQNLREYIILTFSLNGNVFGTIPLPEPCRKAREVYDEIARELRIVDGCLALISRDVCTLSYIRVWVMREYGNVSSWSMVHEFDIIKQFNGVGIEKLLTNGGLLLDKSGTNNYLDDADDRAWYEVYYPDRCLSLEVQKFKKTSGKLEMEMYAESLELLDKGTPFGETVIWEKKKQETKSRRKKRGKKGRFSS